jgi:hypothetical protein
MMVRTWARDNIQKAKLFAEHLANTFQLHIRQTADEYLPKINNKYKAKIKTVTLTEVLNEIAKNLSSKKAPGYDLITGQMMKELQREESLKSST